MRGHQFSIHRVTFPHLFMYNLDNYQNKNLNHYGELTFSFVNRKYFVLLWGNKKKEDMEYTAIIEKTSDGWYIAHCAEIPNAHTQGKTIEEVKENLTDAIELILDCEREISMRKARNNKVFFRKVAVL